MNQSNGGHRRTLSMRGIALKWHCALAVLSSALVIGCSVASRPAREQASSPQNYIAPAPARSLGDLVPPQSLPARDEELWIIEKPTPGTSLTPSPAMAADIAERSPGGGMLLSVHGSTLTPLPLEKTDVHADINGIIASVDVHQRFSNTSKEIADVVYTFPLPQNAAINEFILSIGKRHIRAIVRERAEAEQLFREARSAGLIASLMVQQGPNVFVQRVANLDVGVAIDVEIRYFHTVSCRDGWCEFEFPMIAGLRGEGIRRPEKRDGRNISLAVHLDAGMPIEAVECNTHQITVPTAARPTSVADATLVSADEIPNRDFVFRYKLGADAIKSSLITEKDGDGGTFALLLVPPADIGSVPRRALSDIEIDFDGAAVSEVFPIPLAKFVLNHPIVLTGRYHGSPPTSFDVRGKVGDEIETLKVTARPVAELPGHTPLASIWGRRKIADLTSAAMLKPNPKLDQQVRDVALEYGLVSRYTGFVVVDAMTRAAENRTAEGTR